MDCSNNHSWHKRNCDASKYCDDNKINDSDESEAVAGWVQ